LKREGSLKPANSYGPSRPKIKANQVEIEAPSNKESAYTAESKQALERPQVETEKPETTKTKGNVKGG